MKPKHRIIVQNILSVRHVSLIITCYLLLSVIGQSIRSLESKDQGRNQYSFEVNLEAFKDSFDGGKLKWPISMASHTDIAKLKLNEVIVFVSFFSLTSVAALSFGMYPNRKKVGNSGFSVEHLTRGNSLPSFKIFKRWSRLSLEQERLNQKLELKKRQLITATIAQENLNNRLKRVYYELKGLNVDLKPEVKDCLNKIMKTVKPSIDAHVGWKAFQIHFENVHPSFFSILEQLNASLTHNELKHCAYLQMRLSNKEVAGMLGISATSVKMARNRIKKKLDLASTDSLSTFIHEMTRENI